MYALFSPFTKLAPEDETVSLPKTVKSATLTKALPLYSRSFVNTVSKYNAPESGELGADASLPTRIAC